MTRSGLFGALVFLLAAGSCAFTAAGFLGEWVEIFQLASPFRVQYAAGSAVAAVVLAARRKWRFGALAAGCVAANAFVIFSGSEVDSPAGSGAPLKLVHANVLTSNTRHELVAEFIRSHDPDLVSLQEVDHRWMSSLERLRRTHPHVVAEPRDDNFGIALFSKIPLGDARVVYFGAAGVPSISATIQHKGRSIRVLATHPVPPGGKENIRLRNQQLAEIGSHLAGQTNMPVIVVGDLNVTPWCAPFRSLLRAGNLRASAPSRLPQVTWPASPFWMRIPLDHGLVSGSLVVTRREVGPGVGSDHFPVYFEVGVR